MYSGVPLTSFILAEYIMTNKDRSGLGTGDWAIFRLEFILQDIPARTSRKEQSCEKAGVLPPVIYHQTHATMAKVQTSAELNLSFQSVGLFRSLVLGWRFTGQIKWCALVLMRGEDTTKAAWRRHETPITGVITTNNRNLLPTAISTVRFKSRHDFGKPGYLSVRVSIPLSWMAASSVDGARSSVVCAEDRRHL